MEPLAVLSWKNPSTGSGGSIRLTKENISQVANTKIPQMADVSEGFLLYTEMRDYFMR